MSSSEAPCCDLEEVSRRLDWMRRQCIWPNGSRYLWTDAFGVVLLTSLYSQTGERKYLDQAEWVVSEVYRVLGRTKGIRIGQASNRDGQYYHYLTVWLYALYCLSQYKPQYKEMAIKLAKDIHPKFFIPGVGIIWKMKEDLSGAYPGYGLGGLDHFEGYVVYRLLDEQHLASEIRDLYSLVEATYHRFSCDQDLGVGMMLWNTHWFPDEPWAQAVRRSMLKTADSLWVSTKDGKGFFRRSFTERDFILAFGNYGVSIGLQAVGVHSDRVRRLNGFFKTFRSGDEYDTEAITHVMACCSHLPGKWIKGWQGAYEMTQAASGASLLLSPTTITPSDDERTKDLPTTKSPAKPSCSNDVVV